MHNSANLGLYIADSSSDTFDWTKYLEANFNTIDAQFSPVAVSSVPIRFLEQVSSVPASILTEGRISYLTAASSGFAANTILSYTGTFWQAVGIEKQSSVPVSSNYSGRRVLLSAANGPWQAWDTIVNKDGANTWIRVDTDTLVTATAFRSLSNFPDGFKSLVQVDATNGINWFFRNNANSGSNYKFEAYGGTQIPMYQEIDTNQSTSTTGSWVDLASVGPQITVPLTGEYEIHAAATQTAPSAGTGQIAVNDGSGNILTPQSVSYIGAAASSRLSLVIPRISLARGNTIKVQYQTDTSGYAWSQRTLQLFPLRVNQT